MSNNAVGNVYKTIIDEVIEAARVDFEENGVDEGVLEELRKGWQAKLSNLKVAQFPWDPAPAPAVPVAAPAAPALAHQAHQHVSQQAYTQAQLSPTPNPQSLPGGMPGQSSSQHMNGGQQPKPEPPGSRNETPIKQEPGSGNGPMPSANPAPPSFSGGGIAAQRATNNLLDRYGHSAAGSIGQIHQHFGQQGQGRGQPQPQTHPRPSPAGQTNQAQQRLSPQQIAQYQTQQAAQAKARLHQQQQQQQQRTGQAPQSNPQNGFGQSQVDGASDGYEGVLMQRGANGQMSELGRVEMDRMLHEQMAARAKQMEGGGLMLPLREATRHRTAGAEKPSLEGFLQYDGIDDDAIKEEDDPFPPIAPVQHDEDAINSDLDDPDDDDRQDDNEEDPMAHVMLCMYDKVQRVKNKWKCTLKDGLLSVNGKDYVFHKATGEYEW